MRRVSWNTLSLYHIKVSAVTPRMRRVSWNDFIVICFIPPVVTPRMRRVSWNREFEGYRPLILRSRLAWGVWVEINVSLWECASPFVTPRMRRVSWNVSILLLSKLFHVTPRMRRVSWNQSIGFTFHVFKGHASHEACELKCIIWTKHSLILVVTPRMRRVSWN